MAASGLSPAQRAHRDIRAVDLAVAGMPYNQIADAVGCSKATAWRAVQRGLRAMVDEQYADRKAMLARELRLLDRLTQANLTAALGGDAKASGVVLRAHEARVRLLGLDAPVKVDATVRSQADAEIESLMAQLGPATDGSAGVERW